MISQGASLPVRIGRTVREHSLLSPGDTVIVGLSGGADSTALLDILSRLPGFRLSLVAAHVNHSLRGDESDSDQSFCTSLARSYDIPFEVTRVDVRRKAGLEGLSLEDAGRRARIAFFDSLREKYPCAVIALAHHADDQAETFLIRLLRGSGMTGLSAMSFRNGRGYVRPLLEIRRGELEEYLRDNARDWREDSSNSDTGILRNRIRHELLPLLEQYNPDVRSGLVTTARIIHNENALLQEMAEQNFDALFSCGTDRVTAGVAQLSRLHEAMLCRVLRHAYHRLAGTCAGLSHRHVDSVRAIILSDRPNAGVSLPNGIIARREYAVVTLMKQGAETVCGEYEVLIQGVGDYPLPSGHLLSVRETGGPQYPCDCSTAYFDTRLLPFPWKVRTFRGGDRIVPFGMNGRKKVKNIFIDRKIPVSKRVGVPLLFCGEDLIWVAGFSVSEKSRMGDSPSCVRAVISVIEPKI